MSGGVDAQQLNRYIEIEREVQVLESQNVIKNYEVKNKAAVDVEETIRSVEITLKQLEINTRKEKQDVDNIQTKSIKDMFKDEAHFQRELNREQEEYLEARNKEEVARQQLADLQKQHGELEGQAKAVKEPADKLKKLYEERDTLLSHIFGGAYGSDLENKLEALFDSLMDQKQRISVANYKWMSARVLLHHAVSQLAHSVQKWKELLSIPPQQGHIRYNITTEVRNNLVAAIQNMQSTQRYLETIEFPYCKPQEVETLTKATNNIYTDMQDPQRHQHALQCYDVTWRRAAALLQWFDNVIANTIQRDMAKITEEGRKVETDLRAERIKLIREKIKETGGDVTGLNDAGTTGFAGGLKGLADQTKLSAEDMDMKGIGVTRPAPVDGGPHVPDAQNQGPPPAPAPTPLPLSELAPMPSENDLFGDISALKEQYAKNTEEYLKAQQMNKARMEQGLQAKLAERRHKKQA
ncbi:uncharacterized protein LOC127834460 isoform X1 [Dreissena polymorpha]|uniref:uncharacterized protein LOC127833893 isoform X2 n=1 Tax=Dreissena polymorpha TaxID=45954 RepID=UPI0022653A57|nr:uncharacterized protein LOC127833893 isoform X2 [Dreissena polymorpha]XP_052216273.1 uncharacterized protein LOC127834460 isoform X1 [Dreissena polymorpha]XP_052216274.1 uncharacterized protein LOC127834460 isoform X1 [Dreissena polymorpha]